MNSQLRDTVSWATDKIRPYRGTIVKLVTLLIICGILYAIFRYYKNVSRNRPYLIKGEKDATVELQIPRSKILNSKIGTEFSYSFWINVKDWGHNFNKPKHIFHIGDPDAKSVCPGVWLYPKNNNIMVRVDTHGNKNNMNPSKDKNLIKKELPCDIDNIPVQRWVHVAIVLMNRTLDVYINGKLTRSCLLENVPKFNDGNMFINQNGGYDGLISDLMYSNQALSPNDIYLLYMSGKDAFVLYHHLDKVPL